MLVLLVAVAGLYFYHDKYGISSEERFERELASDKSAAALLEPIRKNYPYEFGKLRRETAESYNLERRGRVLDHLPGEFIMGFLKRHAVEALQGGDRETLVFIDAYAALFSRAEKDKALCDVIYGNEDKLSDPAIMVKQEPFTRMYAAFVELAANGRKNSIRRESPTPADMEAFWVEYRKTQPAMKPDWPATPQQRCARSNAVVRAILARPPEQRIKLISILFQGWR